MSSASRAVNRLRKQYRSILAHMRELNSRLGSSACEVPMPHSPCQFEPLEIRLLLAVVPVIQNIIDAHDGFRFIGGTDLPAVQDTYQAVVTGDVTSVLFTVGGLNYTDSNGADGWSAPFNMSSATTTADLTVKAMGPAGFDQEVKDIDLLLLPDWMTSDGTEFSVTHNWSIGYTFDVTTMHFEKGFYTPDNWVWYVPVVDVPLMDLSVLFTGFRVYSDFTLVSAPSGDVLTSDYEFAFDAFILDEQVVDRRFSLNTAGTVPYNWNHGSVSVSGSIAYDAHVDPFFDNNLLLAGVSGTLTAGMDLTIDMPLGSVRIPLLSFPGIADLVFNASASASLDWNASVTPTLSAGGFGLSHLSTGVDVSFGITGSGSLDVGFGLGTAGASLTGTLSQGLNAEYWASSGWTSLSAPGSLNISGQASYSTLWGFGPSDSFDLFTWEVASWDFLAGTGTTPDSASSREGEYFVPETYAQDIDVTVSASGAPFPRGKPIFVSGTARYDTAPLAVGTAILQFGGNTWTTPITNSGTYSIYIELPQSATDGTLNIRVVDGSDVRVQSGARQGTASIFLDLEEINGSPFCDLDVTTAGGYSIENVPGGTDIYPMDVRELYSPAESGGLWSILRIEDMTDYLQPKVEVYDPDGDLRWTYDAFSASGFTGPGSRAYWSYGWSDIPQFDQAGVWTIEWYLRPVGGSYAKIAADTFTYRYEFTEHMTCRNVQGSDPYGPIEPTNIFSTTDARVYTWMNLDNLSEDISVKWEWYDPVGNLYSTYYADPISTVDASGSFDPPYGCYRVWGWTGITGCGAAGKPGDWRVDVKVKNPWGSWETQYTDHFQLFEEPGVSPVLSVTPSVQNPNVGEPVSLQLNVTDNTWLDDVTVYWDDGTEHHSSWNALFAGSLATTVPLGSFAAWTTVEYWATAVDTSGNMTVLPKHSFTVRLPDLSWNSLVGSPASVTAGETLTATRNYQVATAAVSSNFKIQYRLSVNQTWGDGDDVILPPDESIINASDKMVGPHTGTFVVTVPGLTPAGTYHLLGRVDSGSAIEESDENNNVVVGNQITVSVPQPMVSAKTSSSGSSIPAGTWQQDDDPYFYWSQPQSSLPILGYSVGIDVQPDDSVDTSNTYWQTASDVLSNGTHTFYVKAQDSAGQSGITGSFSIWVDDEGDVLSSLSASQSGRILSSGDWTTNTAVNFAWSVTTGVYSPIVGYSYALDGAPDSSVDTTGTSWQSSALGIGQHSFAVRAIDAVGNVGPVLSFTVNVGTREYVVNSLNDGGTLSDGQLTLREAVVAANTDTATGDAWSHGSFIGFADSDRIAFASSLAGGTITLNGQELAISGNVEIIGDDSAPETIDAGRRSRVLSVSDGNVSLYGLTLTWGSTTSDGGGVANYGTLTLTHTTISGNWASKGGGIYNAGTLTLTNSTVSGNWASKGGGIYNHWGMLTLTNTTVLGNSTAGNGGGIFNYRMGTLALTNTTVAYNSAVGNGGGIYDGGDSALTLTNTTVASNTTFSDGGGIFAGDSTALSLTDTTVTGNTARGGGGGIFAEGATLNLTNTMVSDNTAGCEGGGIYNRDGALTLINTMISGNSGAGEFGIGGGIYNREGTLALTNTTISGNSASFKGGGIYNYYGTLTLNNTIVALNVATAGSPDVDGDFTSHSSLVGVDPEFVRDPGPGPDGLWDTSDDDYGDLRLTIDSPAMNAGDNCLAVYPNGYPLTTDLAGNPRIVDGTVDIGAFELFDLTAPQTTGAIVNGGMVQRTKITSLAVDFNEAVVCAVGALTLTNVTTSQQFDLSGVPFDSATHTWNLSGVELTDGYYTARLSAGAVEDLAGNKMSEDYTFTFHRLAGDTTGDGSVDAMDYITLKSNFGRVGGAAWDSGDLDGDGVVGWSDLQRMMGSFGTRGATPTTAPATPKITAINPVKADITNSTEPTTTTASPASTDTVTEPEPPSAPVSDAVAEPALLPAPVADAAVEPEVLPTPAAYAPPADILAIAASILGNRLAAGRQVVPLTAERFANSLPLSHVAIRVGPVPTFPSPLLSLGRACPVVADVLQLAAPWCSGDSARHELPDEPLMTTLSIDITGKPRKGRLGVALG